MNCKVFFYNSDSRVRADIEPKEHYFNTNEVFKDINNRRWFITNVRISHFNKDTIYIHVSVIPL